MVKMTNVRALGALQAVNAMLRIEIPNARGPYRLYKLQAEIEAAVAAFQQTRDRLLREYGQLDARGNPVITAEGDHTQLRLKDQTPETAQAFSTQFAALLAEEVELKTQIPLSLLEGATLKGEWFAALGALVVDE